MNTKHAMILAACALLCGCAGTGHDRNGIVVHEGDIVEIVMDGRRAIVASIDPSGNVFLTYQSTADRAKHTYETRHFPSGQFTVVECRHSQVEHR